MHQSILKKWHESGWKDEKKNDEKYTKLVDWKKMHESGGCMINAPKVDEKMAWKWRMHDKCNQSEWKNGTRVEDA